MQSSSLGIANPRPDRSNVVHGTASVRSSSTARAGRARHLEAPRGTPRAPGGRSGRGGQVSGCTERDVGPACEVCVGVVLSGFRPGVEGIEQFVPIEVPCEQLPLGRRGCRPEHLGGALPVPVGERARIAAMRSSPEEGSTGSTAKEAAMRTGSGAGIAATASPMTCAIERASSGSMSTIAGCSPAKTLSSTSRWLIGRNGRSGDRRAELHGGERRARQLVASAFGGPDEEPAVGHGPDRERGELVGGTGPWHRSTPTSSRELLTRCEHASLRCGDSLQDLPHSGSVSGTCARSRVRQRVGSYRIASFGGHGRPQVSMTTGTIIGLRLVRSLTNRPAAGAPPAAGCRCRRACSWRTRP